MQHKSAHEKTASAKLTFVVLSDAEKPSRSFKASRFQLVVIVLFGFVVIGALSVFVLIDTPIGKLILPEYFSTQAEQLERVRALEDKVEAVQQQLSYLASYNLKLRRVLGDTMTSSDTSTTSRLSQLPTVQPGARSVAVEPPMTGNESLQHGSEQTESGIPQQTFVQTQLDESASLFPLLPPVQGFVTRSVDYSIQHYGLDISAPEGEAVVSPAAGEVLFADWTLAGGNTLIIAHADDYLTVYKHCERILVSVGTQVARGEIIGLVGTTGTTSTGPHLHFELWRNGKNLNPENYLLKNN